MRKIIIDRNSRVSLVKQITQSLISQIEKGQLRTNDQLPSINDFSDAYDVARDTIEKAYKLLREEGYIVSIPSRGYFIAEQKNAYLRVLLILNKLSSYKKLVYDSFLQTLGTAAKVDLQIHHYDPNLLREIIEQNRGRYHYQVVMPHFFRDADRQACLKVLKMIPESELMLLDKAFPELEGEYPCVYQDFANDICNALHGSGNLMKRYNRLELIFPEYNHNPQEITEGVRRYCSVNDKEFRIVQDAAQVELSTGTAFIVLTEADLAGIIKKAKLAGLQPGKEFGIISFNETVLKELLDITVVTTDFEAMGRTAARMLLNGSREKIANPFSLIQRSSL